MVNRYYFRVILSLVPETVLYIGTFDTIFHNGNAGIVSYQTDFNLCERHIPLFQYKTKLPNNSAMIQAFRCTGTCT